MRYCTILFTQIFSAKLAKNFSTLVAQNYQYTLCCLTCGLLLGACQPPDVQTQAQTPIETKASYSLDFDHHDLMTYVLDPAADVIWSSAGEIVTTEGTQDLAPTTDEGWQQVQNNAAVLIESANMLLLPGRAEDQEDWAEYSLGLATMSRKAFVAAQAKDADALFAAGADLYQVCLACHQKYAREES